VAPEDVDALPPEVGEHEPRAALIESGATEAIAEQALGSLAPGGSVAFEVADGKAGEVAALLRRLGYEQVTIGEDLAGRERVVDGRAPR
jgi:release factor glutamine methyltransferase